MSLFTIITILVVVSALFSYINERYVKLPYTIGAMVITMVMCMILTILGWAHPDLTNPLKILISEIEFSTVLLEILLSFLLFAGALHTNFDQLRVHRGPILAFATIGQGYPLVRAGHWLTHLEHDWQSPIWRPFLNALGEAFSVTRYDQRGNGLSDWSVNSLTLEDFTNDLKAVTDQIDQEKFALYGTSQGAPIAINFAIKYPQRVSHLILHGGYAQGRFKRSEAGEAEQGEALITLMKHGWGKLESPFLKAFSSMYIPDGSQQQVESLVELQRLTTSPGNAVSLRKAVDDFDVSALLSKVNVPTLVLHARSDGIHPLNQGRMLAGGIKDAEFILLESANHVILEQEPAWEVLLRELRNFVNMPGQ